MKIRVLDDKTINKIAAGEVVDRPGSVVRELVDNSLDAGATEVVVYLESGGRSLIRVVDNGCGLSRDDALLAFERHATSKIVSVDDLQTIVSYGFRGEALASIAAVSRVELKTRTAHEQVATAVTMDGGALKDVQEVRGLVGTEVAVHRLFFNTPVRRKFLRQPTTEVRLVLSRLKHCALGNPQVRFRLFSDGQEILSLSRAQSIIDRGLEMWPGGIRVDFTASSDDSARQGDSDENVSEVGTPCKIEGVIGHPSMVTADSSEFVFLVNRRVVTDRVLLKAVREGFLSTLKDREFPIGFLSLTIDPAYVDINVHPQKSEVRFINRSEVYRSVRDAVQSALNGCRKPAPGAIYEANKQYEQDRQYNITGCALTGNESANPELSESVVLAANSSIAPRDVFVAHNFVPQRLELVSKSRLPTAGEESNLEVVMEEKPIWIPRSSSSADNPAIERGVSLPEDEVLLFSELRYIGQLFACYLLCEQSLSSGKGRLVVIDMHAAHERYNFNLVRSSFFKNGFPCQQLLIPLAVRVGMDGVARLEEHSSSLQTFGILVERFGDDSVLVRGLPTIVADGKAEQLIRDLASCELELMTGDRIREMVDTVSARIACHASIRSGRRMEAIEVRELFAALDTAEFSMACPHGRPIVASFSEGVVERWFGRDR